MKKILVLALISLFLASCVGEAVSKSVEDINIIVSPPTAGLKVELYSGNLLMGSAITNSKGSVTFSKLPIGAYRAVVSDAAGVKITDKYMTSVFVSGPNAFKAYVNVPKAPVTPPAKVCTPGQSWCENNMARTCRSDGVSIDGTLCVAPTPVCTTASATSGTYAPKAVCVQCTADSDCTSGQKCQGNTCTTPTQVCTPNQITCKDANTKSVCNAAGTAVTDTACTAPTGKCLAGTGCVACTSNTDCTGGQLCTNNVCTTPVPTQICTPNKLWCEGNILKTCSSNGLVVQQTVCTGTTPFCDSASTKCVGCRYNTDCAAGSTCQNNVCMTAPSACVRCRAWISPTNCEWVYKGLCEFEGKGGYPVCNTFISYLQYMSLPCSAVNPYTTIGGPNGIGGTIPIGGQQINLYKAYECCDKSASGQPVVTAPVIHCPNGIVEAALGEECEPPNTATCDANCKRKTTILPTIHCPNGVVEASLGEECEPPNTATCDANCKRKPVINCPNGIVEAALGEECEPPNTATCDAYCKLVKEPAPPGIYWVPYSPCAVPTTAGYSSCNLASYNCPVGVHTTPMKCTAPLGTICKGPSSIDLPSIQGVSWLFLYKCSYPPAGSPLV